MGGKKLGELLIQDKLIDADQLKEALDCQKQHRGRLGTNLVELGLLAEKDLARILGKQHEMPFASGVMTPDPAALKVAPLEWFDEYDLIPMRMDATKLTIAVMEPRRIKPLVDLGFKLEKRIVEVVIPEFRMNQMQRKYCNGFRDIRPIDSGALRPRKSQGAGEPKPADSAGVINDSEFANIFANAKQREEDDAVVEGQTLPEPVEPEPVEPSPLSFAEAEKRLRKCASAEEIAAAVLRFARGRLKRAVLLTLKPSAAVGWTGMGKGVVPGAVRRITVPLHNEQNPFAAVRDLGSYFVGPLPATPGMRAFFQGLGGGPPKSAAVLPLLAAGRTVHVLYVDNGPGQPTPLDLAELLSVTESASIAYEMLAARP